jgi:hypothetical protein
MKTTMCRDCGGVVSTRAATCPRCGAPQKRAAGGIGCVLLLLLIAGVGGFVLFVLVAGIGLIAVKAGSGGQPASGPATNPSTKPTVPAVPVRNQPVMDIRVTSLIVKHVGGKYRYFFDIRNYDKTPFSGEVTITLTNQQPGRTNGTETFSTTKPMLPGLGTVVDMDAHTGPPNVHGDAGVVGFRFEAMVNRESVARGSGRISEKYEDLRE